MTDIEVGPDAARWTPHRDGDDVFDRDGIVVSPDGHAELTWPDQP